MRGKEMGEHEEGDEEGIDQNENDVA